MSNNKKPFNPYYLSLWYFAIVSAISIALVAADKTSIHALYLFLQAHGVESMALRLRRYNSMHQYLIEVGDNSRWEAIVCYLGYSVPLMVLLMLLVPLFGNRYLQWFATAHAHTKPDRSTAVIRKLYCFQAFFFSLLLFMFYLKFFSISTWGNSVFSTDKIHFSAVGYFYLALEYAAMIGILQVCHFIYFSTAYKRVPNNESV